MIKSVKIQFFEALILKYFKIKYVSNKFNFTEISQFSIDFVNKALEKKCLHCKL